MKAFLLYVSLLMSACSYGQSDPLLFDSTGYFSPNDSLLIEAKLAELDSVVDFRIVVVENVLSPQKKGVALKMYREKGLLGDEKNPDIVLVYDFKANAYDLHVTWELVVLDFDRKVRENMASWSSDSHIAQEIVHLTEALAINYSETKSLYASHPKNNWNQEKLIEDDNLNLILGISFGAIVFIGVIFMIKYFGGEKDESEE